VFGASKLAKLVARVTRVLREARFENPDIGPLNDAMEVDYFVISIPKCGTTAIQRGIEGVDRKVIHAHTNASLYAAFANGDVLMNNGVGLEAILKARLAVNSKPIQMFFGYREPISWYLSVAGHFGLEMDESLERDIIDRAATYPWNNYGIDDVNQIYRQGTGVNVLTCEFNHKAGIGLFQQKGVNLLTYRLDRIAEVQTYIAENIHGAFKLNQERVNADPNYNAIKKALSVAPRALAELYSNRWFRHFYAPAERDALSRLYLRGDRNNRKSACQELG